jgi:CHAT domain-containing protein
MYTDAGEPRKGLPALERADALAERLDRTIRAILRWHRGRAEHHLGDLTAGIAHLQSAILEIERIRSQLSSADQRATFVGMTRMFFDALVDALADRYLRDGDEASAAEALSEVERARARSLLDRLAEARVDLRRGADPQLIAEESARRGELRDALGAHLRLVSQEAESEQVAAAARQVESLTAELDRLSVRLRLASPAYAELTQPRPLDLASIRERVLDDHTVLLEYSLQEPRSYLWVATRRTLQLHVLPSGARIEALVRRAYGGWSVRTPLADDARAAAVELAQTVLGPAADALGDLRLLVVPDGALVSLPFSALPDPRAPAQPLLVRNEIVSAPSASVVAALRAPGRARRAPSSTLAVLADPVFTQDDARLARARSTAAAAPSGLGRLAFSRREARAIGALVRPGQRHVLLDLDASRDRALGPEVAGARLVHFATHGYFDPSHARQSGLVFSLVDRRRRPRAGLLSTADAFNLELSADLVVLSGCRTGLGEEIRGEGLLGLTRAFMYAGAPRVVASLWTVDDAATATLMARFYRGLLVHGERPAEALRAAQLALRSESRFAHPYYWAAFELQGDWR